ncbi:hypothetical protein [Luteococcus peritonei]|uniref:Uncharacterized protein n=1 Tax=Luteococcus peritonei TaxID=88874 RepID=A0ABW4RV18_9ACTN
MTSTLVRATLAAALACGSFIAAPSDAQAAGSQCAAIRATTVAGYNFSRLPTRRVCKQDLRHGVSGTSSQATRTITVHYARSTSTTSASKATLHEMTHQVEYRTTPAQRAALYRYLGIRTSGNYYAFNDAWYYTGSLSRWKASPRERLAESVVNCRYGRPNHTGMSLVPRYRCTAFLNQYKAALSVAR